MSRKAWYWTVLIMGLLVIGGMARLRFDVDVLNLLPADLPVVEGLKLYQQHFTDSRELILTVRSSDPAKTEAAAKGLVDTLRSQTNLTASVIWQPAWQERPAQAAELIGYIWLNQPPSEFNQLAARLSGTNIDATLADAREQLATSLSPMGLATRAYDPYNFLDLPASVSSAASSSFSEGQNIFSSPDKTFRLIFVKAKPDISGYRNCIAWLKALKSVVQSARGQNKIGPDVIFAFTGSPAFLAEISGGMEHDMISSIGLTSIIIAILFWIFHRRLVPMLWLLLLLAIILVCTLALGGLFFGTINVVSLGFAGILLGLAVDYGVVHYQEAMASPNAIIPEIRRAIGPSIFWAAVTTISAFLVLNFGGVPGLGQLGSLVALGVTLSALVMLFAFLPPLFRDRIKKRRQQEASTGVSPSPAHPDEKPDAITTSKRVIGFGGTPLLILAAIFVLSSGVPKLDHTADALRPLHSPAYTALDEIKKEIAQNREPLWLITKGRDELEIARRLEVIRPVLETAVSNRQIASFTLPTPLWPRPDYQLANHSAASTVIAQRDTLRAAALKQGFTSNSLVLLDGVLNTWQASLAQAGTFWPANEMSRWIFDRFAAHPPGQFLAVGFIFVNTNAASSTSSFPLLSQSMSDHGFILSGWELLGSAILKKVQQNMWKVLLPMIVLVLLSLWLAFRRSKEILLSLAVLTLSGLCLLTTMRLAGWSWNLLNLMALPLMLGSGVDYSIFMQLALRRHRGNLAAAHRAVGRALLLCGGTAVAGFGSLSFSTNAGMSSLGEVCAVGIAANMLISVYLLPVWWRKLAGREYSEAKSPAPSSLYRAGLWRVGLRITRLLPSRVCARVSLTLADIYWILAPHRREVVIQNLLPPLNGDRAAAKRKAHEMVRQFALKVADLWRYESGLPIDDLFGEWTGWEHFARAQAEKRGTLLLTPHLGNWEFGGPLLTKRGVKLQVITLVEPGNGLTELRRASRARWDIETLVIGEDPFAFVEVIRRLEAGATVALLVDRPPPASRTTVELFGRPFAASIAAAELARASGCVLLPVYLPHTGHSYAAHILPAIDYDRRALRQREERQRLTQQIIHTFEPAIREHLDQWYHFVPVWETGD